MSDYKKNANMKFWTGKTVLAMGMVTPAATVGYKLARQNPTVNRKRAAAAGLAANAAFSGAAVAGMQAGGMAGRKIGSAFGHKGKALGQLAGEGLGAIAGGGSAIYAARKAWQRRKARYS